MDGTGQHNRARPAKTALQTDAMNVKMWIKYGQEQRKHLDCALALLRCFLFLFRHVS
jgi:hypothetical protein